MTQQDGLIIADVDYTSFQGGIGKTRDNLCSIHYSLRI